MGQWIQVDFEPDYHSTRLNSVLVEAKVINDSELEVVSESIILTLNSIQSGDASIISPITDGPETASILRDQLVSVIRLDDSTEGGNVGTFRIQLNAVSNTATTVSFVLDGDAINGGTKADYNISR